MEEISSEQIRLRAVQLNGQDNDDRKWIKWFIALQPKSVIRISLCRTAKRNPNDRFEFKVEQHFHLLLFHTL